jgi:hypothetical protein
MRIYNYGGGSSDARGRTISNGNSSLIEQAGNPPISALRKQIESLPPEKAKPLINKLERMREQTNDPLATLKNQIDILSLGKSESLSYMPTYPTYTRMGLKTMPR